MRGLHTAGAEVAAAFSCLVWNRAAKTQCKTTGVSMPRRRAQWGRKEAFKRERRCRKLCASCRAAFVLDRARTVRAASAKNSSEGLPQATRMNGRCACFHMCRLPTARTVRSGALSLVRPRFHIAVAGHTCLLYRAPAILGTLRYAGGMGPKPSQSVKSHTLSLPRQSQSAGTQVAFQSQP